MLSNLLFKAVTYIEILIPVKRNDKLPPTQVTAGGNPSLSSL